MQLFRFTCGPYTMSLADDVPPLHYSYCRRAQLVEAFELESSSNALCYLTVARGHDWPFLIVAQRYSPGPQSGFYPGVLVAPETGLLFLGAGERLLAYTLDPPGKVWEYYLHSGFCQWERSQECVVMSSEHELAVWNIHGQKRWDFAVSPPWQYAIQGDTIHVYMGNKQTALHCERGIVIEGTAVQS